MHADTLAQMFRALPAPLGLAGQFEQASTTSR
jgi:hypothetical protein